MELSRRDFLRASGAGVGGLFLLGALKDGVALALPVKHIPLIKTRGEKTTICPYDGSGCGFIIDVQDGRAVNIEGDPDHPVNRGAACSKGSALRQLSADNPWRLSKVLYRRPGGDEFEEKDWDWAINEIARRIKDTRDSGFITTNAGGNPVNRTGAIANLGGSALNNEECYLLVKMARALGLVYIEHHARL